MSSTGPGKRKAAKKKAVKSKLASSTGPGKRKAKKRK